MAEAQRDSIDAGTLRDFAADRFGTVETSPHGALVCFRIWLRLAAAELLAARETIRQQDTRIAELERLRPLTDEEIDERIRRYHDTACGYQRMVAALMGALRERERALEQYGQHRFPCAVQARPPSDCTCGFAAALDATRAPR